MTHPIKKSQVAAMPDIEKKVSQHVTEMQFWHDRKKIVAEEEKTPLGPRPVWSDYVRHKTPMEAYGAAVVKWEADRLKRHALVKRPNPHPIIDACVRQDGETFIADYEIVNDDPTADQVLREKKNALLIKISELENSAQGAALLPPGKRRLADIRENDIRRSDEAILQKAFEGITYLKELSQKRESFKPEDHRSPEDTQHLANQAARRSKVDAISRAAAQAMSDVEDLTVDNVDAYQISNFDMQFEVAS